MQDLEDNFAIGLLSSGEVVVTNVPEPGELLHLGTGLLFVFLLSKLKKEGTIS